MQLGGRCRDAGCLPKQKEALYSKVMISSLLKTILLFNADKHKIKDCPAYMCILKKFKFT